MWLVRTFVDVKTSGTDLGPVDTLEIELKIILFILRIISCTLLFSVYEQ